MTKVSILDQNFDVWPKVRCLTNSSIFDQNFVVWSKLRFLVKISSCPKFYIRVELLRNIHRKCFYLPTGLVIQQDRNTGDLPDFWLMSLSSYFIDSIRWHWNYQRSCKSNYTQSRQQSYKTQIQFFGPQKWTTDRVASQPFLGPIKD